ncbi:MAG: hypothetical protein JW774_03270 [Candidatus Aureabacteria bacterium]|nr:hypothetical protein [Candidatus Auribacterota bacterium]
MKRMKYASSFLTRSQAILLASGLFVLFLGLAGLFFPVHAGVFLSRLPGQFMPLFAALMIQVSCVMTGEILLNAVRICPPRPIRFFVNMLVGMQVWIFLTLILGFSSLLYSSLFWGLMIFFNGWFLIRHQEKMRGIITDINRRYHLYGEKILWVLTGLLMLILFANGYSPFSWYDSLVYHMAVPAKYMQAHSIHYIPGNMYSNFPMNAEMLNLNCLLLGRELAAKFLIVFQILFILFMCADYIFEKTGNGFITLFAVGFIGSNQEVFKQIIQGNIDLFVSFSCCVYLFQIHYASFQDRKDFILTGILAGITAGFKYQAGLFFVLPGLVYLVIRLLRQNLSLRNMPWTFLTAALVFFPWLLKNHLLTGNPVFPFFSRFFDTLNWDDFRHQQFIRFHKGTGINLPLLLKKLFSDLDGSLIPLSFFHGELSLVPLLVVPVWGMFSIGDIRYLLPVYPILMSCGIVHFKGFLQKRFWKPLTMLLVIYLFMRITAVFLLNYQIVPYALGLKSAAERLFTLNDPYFKVREYLNKTLLPRHHILMIAEAKTYGCHFNVYASTLYDKNLLEDVLRDSDDIGQVLQLIKDRGFTHILFNLSEWTRLQDSYQSRYPAVAGYAFAPGSKEESLYYQLLNVLRQKNVLPEELAKWFVLFRL